MPIRISPGAAEEVSVIDKIGIEPTIRILFEDGLPVIDMLCADVDHPCQPETSSVADPLERETGQDFGKVLSVLSQESRAEA